MNRIESHGITSRRVARNQIASRRMESHRVDSTRLVGLIEVTVKSFDLLLKAGSDRNPQRIARTKVLLSVPSQPDEPLALIQAQRDPARAHQSG